MSDPTENEESSDLDCKDGTLFGNHKWVEEYYGTRCTKCKTFYPHGCAPWDEEVREGFDFNDGDTEECVHGVLLCDECIDCEMEEHELEDSDCDY